jgi:WD40 repeat protein
MRINKITFYLSLYVMLYVFFACNTIIIKILPDLVEIPKEEGQPPRMAYFQIEAGYHTAEVRAFSVHSAGNLLVTASEDKTVRVWKLTTGELLSVIRPPIDEKKEGELYAVALSPDAKTIACAGWTGDAWDHTFTIYFFDLESGTMIHLISGLPDAILSLAYSPSGAAISATLSGASGLRVYNTTNYKLLGYDKDYAKESHVARFDKSGRLATSSYDGHIRLYDSSFNLLKKMKTVGGEMPHSLDFSPDGTEIAVGFLDSNKIDIYSAKIPIFFNSYLDHKQTIRSNEVEAVNLSVLKYSQDGRFLYSAGKFSRNNRENIIRWNTKPYTVSSNIDTGLKSISSIIAISDKEFLVSAFNGRYIIFSDTQINYDHPTAFIDYSNQLESLYVSQNGNGVRIKLKDDSVLQFSTGTKKVIENPTETGGFFLPTKSGVGLVIKDWKDKNSAIINGKTIALSPGDYARSLAIYSDEKAVAIGGDKYIYQYNNVGSLLWKTYISDAVVKINVSENKALLVAALGDGTIRWFRNQDGVELKALRFFPNKKDWLLYTPLGFYDSSPAMEEYVGWVINSTRNSSSIFMPAALTNRYYYKDTLQKVIQTNKSDTELVLLFGMQVSDLKENFFTIYESIKKAMAEGFEGADVVMGGTPISRVFSTNPVTGEVIIISATKGPLLDSKEKLFVIDEDKKIPLQITKSMHVITKCKVIEDQTHSLIRKVKLNAVVYREQ